MSAILTDAELVAREHVLSKSLSLYDRRVEMCLPLYSCECGRWKSETTANFGAHIEAELATLNLRNLRTN